VAFHQARSQLGTPGGAKSFLRRSQTVSYSFEQCPTHFSRGKRKIFQGLHPPSYGPVSHACRWETLIISRQPFLQQGKMSNRSS